MQHTTALTGAEGPPPSPSIVLVDIHLLVTLSKFKSVHRTAEVSFYNSGSALEASWEQWRTKAERGSGSYHSGNTCWMPVCRPSLGPQHLLRKWEVVTSLVWRSVSQITEQNNHQTMRNQQQRIMATCARNALKTKPSTRNFAVPLLNQS